MVAVVSVPSFGDSFFIYRSQLSTAGRRSGFRPLIRGFFFYNKPCNSNNQFDNSSFRPLIRGFFFYPVNDYSMEGRLIVFVPSLGDSFFIVTKDDIKDLKEGGFRPLIRGFFFYERK